MQVSAPQCAESRLWSSQLVDSRSASADSSGSPGEKMSHPRENALAYEPSEPSLSSAKMWPLDFGILRLLDRLS